MMTPIEILLVEDDSNDLELMRRALEKRRLTNRIHEVRDGAEAIDYFFGKGNGDRQLVPHVIFLDLKLPKVDGLEVLRRLKAEERTRAIPVVVLTSSNEESDRIRSYDLGVNSYVVKPVGFKEFSQVVEDIGLYWLVHNRPPVPRQADG